MMGEGEIISEALTLFLFLLIFNFAEHCFDSLAITELDNNTWS